nr:FIVAR domain-containing protein [Clostridiales bacterium]
MKKNTKKIFSLILSIALVLTTIPMVSFVSFAQTVSVGTLQELQDALANESVDTITVTQRIDLPDGTIIYGNNKTVTAVKTGLNDQGIVQTGSNYSIFRTDSNATVKIYDLTIMGGSTTAVVNATGTLYLDNVTITRSGSESVTGGGGLINGTQQLSGGNNTGYESARIVMTNSSILRNVAEYGGGFVNYGTMVIDSCSLTENRSLGTAGGGGAGENQGIAYINNTTVANNTSSEIGGGINNCKGGELYLMNSTFTGNVTTNGNSSFGGAIGNNYKLVKAVNCIFAYNYYIRNDGTPEVCDLGVYDSTSLDIKHCITVDVEGKATWNTVCGETCSAKADDLFADVIQGSVLMGDGTESTEPYDRPPVVLNESGELYAPLSGEYVWDITGVPTYFDYSDLDNIRMYYTDDEGNVSADSIYAGNYDPTNPDLIKEDYDVPVSGSLDDEDRDPTLIGSSNVLPSDKVIYTVKVLASAHGSVTGGTVYGDSYISFAPGIPVSLDQIVTAKITAIPDNGYYFSGWEIVEGGSSSGDASAIAAEIQALNTLKADINTAVSDIAASITAINQNINRANNTNRTYNTVRQTLVNDTNTLVNALNGYKTTFASFNDVVSAITDANLSTKTFSRNRQYRDWCDNAINTGNSVSDLLTAHISEVDASIVAKQAEYEAAIASQGTTPQGAINTSNNPLEFVIDSDITLRAMFTASAPDYTVTFHSNTDPDVTATQTFSAGNYTQNLNANTFTNEEQPFLGWAIVYCGEVVYADGTSYTASGNADLYARWGYTVEYNWNNGRNGPNSQIKIPGEALTISNTVPVKDGYTFVGWGITADATTAALQPGDEYGLDRNITLYAIWQELKAPTVINSTLDNGYLNVPYSDTIETDQEGIFVLADGSSLPAGLTIGKDGTISGTPTETGTYSFTINVYNKADTSYSDVSTITMTITISDPKSALRSLVNEANAVDQDLYTDTTADNLQDAIDEAQAVLDNPGATQDEINQAIENLTEALNQLALDKSALASAIAAGQTITSDPNATDDYTAESLAALENAILQGEIVYENSKATAAQIAQATQDILDAINNLVPIGVDTTVLVNAINTANALDEDDYTDSSWQAVEDAVTAGQAVLNNPSSTQSQINDAAQAILDAIAALELDKSGLQNAIDTANGLNEDNYTASTWDDLEDAVTAGTAVLNNPDATVDEIAQATQSILDAISNLIDKSELADKKAEAENTDTTG